VPDRAPLLQTVRMSSTPSSTERAAAAIASTGIAHRTVAHGRVNSLAEAAEARGVEVQDVVKTIVVRRSDDDYLLILVPGDRTISWPKLRTLLGVNRVSMPDATTAKEVTGFERGTITPFGTLTPLPVIADERIQGREVALGAGGHGVAEIVQADDAIRVLAAQVADVTEPE
jgi:Cys-tRNA(Pro)/Cys-tRNA(Cys) deacylase